jgi:hypothetical protein
MYVNETRRHDLSARVDYARGSGLINSPYLDDPALFYSYVASELDSASAVDYTRISYE